MVAAHRGPRGAYSFSAEGHFPGPKYPAPPPGSDIFFRAVKYFSRPARAFVSPLVGVFFAPPGPPPPKYVCVFFNVCARVLGRRTHNFKTYEKICRAQASRGQEYFFPGGGTILRPGRKYVFPSGAEYFYFLPAGSHVSIGKGPARRGSLAVRTSKGRRVALGGSGRKIGWSLQK